METKTKIAIIAFMAVMLIIVYAQVYTPKTDYEKCLTEKISSYDYKPRPLFASPIHQVMPECAIEVQPKVIVK